MRLDAKGGSMEHVPVKDTDNMSVPAPAVAVALADAYRLSHAQKGTPSANPDLRTSFIEAGLGTADMLHMSWQDAINDKGVDESDVVLYLSKKGSCSAAALRSEPELVDRVEYLADNYDAQERLREDPSQRSINHAASLVNRPCKTGEKTEEEKVASNKDALLAKLKEEASSTEATVRNQLKRACPDSARVPTLISVDAIEGPNGNDPKQAPSERWPDADPKHPGVVRKVILDQLNGRNFPGPIQPIAVGFCTEVLTQGSSHKDTEKNCEPFVALVIGKRINPATQRCQVLVQPSFGSECQTKENSNAPFSKEWACKDGKLYVDLDALARNASDYTFLK